MAIDLNLGDFSDGMDEIIEVMGQTCTLNVYPESYDGDGYLDGDPAATSTTETILIDPEMQQEEVMTDQGRRIIGQFRGHLKSTVTIDLGTDNRYEIIDADGVVYDVVAVEDLLDIGNTKTGVDVILRRNDT